jgi:hypothetical protein
VDWKFVSFVFITETTQHKMAVAGTLEAAVEEFKTEQKNLQGNYEAK